MKSNKIGIWMDYSHAVFIDPFSLSAEFEILNSLHSTTKREKGEESNKVSFHPGQVTNNEYKVHKKEINDQKHYFKAIAERLKQYEELFFFGPTDASRLLFLELQEIQEFRNKKMAWEKTDKMTDNQLLARVKSHFFEKTI